MAKVDSWTCDTCHTQKQAANRWWLVTTNVTDASLNQRPTTVTIGEWDAVCANNVDAHLCGESCVVQWLSKHVLGVGQ